jgi:predicted site-specific integrase-resolvase
VIYLYSDICILSLLLVIKIIKCWPAAQGMAKVSSSGQRHQIWTKPNFLVETKTILSKWTEQTWTQSHHILNTKQIDNTAYNIIQQPQVRRSITRQQHHSSHHRYNNSSTITKIEGLSIFIVWSAAKTSTFHDLLVHAQIVSLQIWRDLLHIN